MTIRDFLLLFGAPLSECRYHMLTEEGETKNYSLSDMLEIVDFYIKTVTVEKSDKFDITFFYE